MRPKLLTSPRSTPLDLILIGANGDVTSAVLNQLEAEGIQADRRNLEPLFDLLERAAFGQLRYGRDVKIVKSTLPQLLFQLRYSFTSQSGVVQGRVFCTELLPNTIFLLGWFFKLAGNDSEATRLHQTEAARRALRESEKH